MPRLRSVYLSSDKVSKIRRILGEIILILRRNPNLLNDEEVREWVMMIYGVALEYGDSRVRKFFKEIRSKLLP